MTEQLKRNTTPIRMRNYGRIVQDMISFAGTMENTQERESLEVYIALCMRQRNIVWNRDQEAGMNRVREDIQTLSGGRLKCDSKLFDQLIAQPNSPMPGGQKKKKTK